MESRSQSPKPDQNNQNKDLELLTWLDGEDFGLTNQDFISGNPGGIRHFHRTSNRRWT